MRKSRFWFLAYTEAKNQKQARNQVEKQRFALRSRSGLMECHPSASASALWDLIKKYQQTQTWLQLDAVASQYQDGGKPTAHFLRGHSWITCRSRRQRITSPFGVPDTFFTVWKRWSGGCQSALVFSSSSCCLNFPKHIISTNKPSFVSWRAVCLEDASRSGASMCHLGKLRQL